MQNQFLSLALSLSAIREDHRRPEREDAWLDRLRPVPWMGRRHWYQRALARLGDLLIIAGKTLKEHYAANQSVAWSAR
ncbi:hypothetical protein GW866_00015 [bacterium]|nr:hypothetical protein [bacterium]OIO85137.1 MAG: hypothetical protein AUK02_06805 [Anaerolineae bacterium CG2_30_58_95]PIU91074.1 MAG: hypothetical protein COS63_01890 [Anaerolineae bacterium CG06_land_8_20_14_3_00_57_67]PIW21037.1 MAG: hypothetical protein COW33_00255 [Anaerolineae bacterium CG17_big_fil_post_rev_8_21_14_2_50_57_27]PIZ25714.1 MAG: hypothetical protein COY47_04440 [Chloroflexi bacterium CG_4_10_14_0_8_um_filter_57_5]